MEKLFYLVILICSFSLLGFYTDTPQAKKIRKETIERYEQKYKDIKIIDSKFIYSITEPEELYWAFNDNKRKRELASYTQFRYNVKGLLPNLVKKDPSRAVKFLNYFTDFEYELDLIIIRELVKNNESESLVKVKKIYHKNEAMISYLEFLQDKTLIKLLKAGEACKKNRYKGGKEISRELKNEFRIFYNTEAKAKQLIEHYVKHKSSMIKTSFYEIFSTIKDLPYLENLSKTSEFR